MAHEIRKGGDNWLETNLGREVTVEGKAVNLKTGAQVSTDHGAIYIDGLDSWPEVRRVRVKGTLIKRYDLPVFENRPGVENPSAGIPVKPGADLREASKRYLLTSATWKIIE